MSSDLVQSLKPFLRTNPTPGGEPFWCIGREGLSALMQKRGYGLKEAMLECLDAGIWPERFRANAGSLSPADQARLLRSKACVIGCGGLGGVVIIELARMGLGGLAVCDADVFDESNLNRQFLSNLERIGVSKAQAARYEALALNPAMEVTAHHVWADEDNLPGFLKGAQVAVDCLDNMPGRYALEEVCARAGIPYVHGALAGWEGFVMVVRPGDPGVRGLYGPTPAAKEHAAEVRVGTPTPTPPMVSTLQVNEVVKLLMGRPGLGKGQMLHVDLSEPSLEILSLA